MVTYNVTDAVNEFTAALADLLDIVLTQDKANCSAKSDIVVDLDYLYKLNSCRLT